LARFAWRPFLERYSRDLLADEAIRRELPGQVVASGWMGFAPATARELSELEDRLQTKLPTSYREFLATTNGWRETGSFIWQILPAAKVDWFRTENQDWIDAYVEPAGGYPPLPLEEHLVYGPRQDNCRFRVQFLQSALQISAVGDSAVYLLNPEVRTRSGEWEAWFFATWAPGADRYRSFRELMQEQHKSFVELRDRQV
jgi:hypothetical protein